MPDAPHADTSTELHGWTDESMLRMVADAVPALLACYTLPEMRCVFANTGYVVAHGLTVETMLGRTAREILGDKAWADVQIHARRVAAGERVQEVELEGREVDPLVAAAHLLGEVHRGAAQFARAGDDGEHVVHPRRLQEVQHHRRDQRPAFEAAAPAA